MVCDASSSDFGTDRDPSDRRGQPHRHSLAWVLSLLKYNLIAQRKKKTKKAGDAMVAQAVGGDGRPQSRPLDESDAAPTPPGAGGDDAGAAAAKKRKLASTARGVANLTPEQLAKKRANGMLSTTHSHVDTTDTALRSRGAEGYSRAHKEPDSNSGAPRRGAHQPATVPGTASGHRGQGSSREG